MKPRDAAKPVPSWILVHSHKGYGGKGQYESPKEQLAEIFEPNMLWHWKLSKPMKNDFRPRKILLSWDQSVFGEATVTITRDVDPEFREEFNFAFVLVNYRLLRKGVPFSRLRLGNRETQHRGLISLEPENWAAYEELASVGRLRGLSSSPEVASIEKALAAASRTHSRQGSRKQAFFPNAEQKKCVELRGMGVAERYLRQRGFDVVDVSKNESFDLEATKAGKTWFVEVKATTGGGEEILLTKNEVKLHQSKHPLNMLLVVHSIRLDRSGKKPNATGGTVASYSPWSINKSRLKPIGYSYAL